MAIVAVMLGLAVVGSFTGGSIFLVRRFLIKRPNGGIPKQHPVSASVAPGVHSVAHPANPNAPIDAARGSDGDWRERAKYEADLLDKAWPAGGESAYESFMDLFRKNNLPHWRRLSHAQNGWQTAIAEKNHAAQRMRDFLRKESWLDGFGNRQWSSPNGRQRYDSIVRDYAHKSQAARKTGNALAEQSRIFNKNARFIDNMRSVGKGVSTGLNLAGVMQDTLSNMTPHNRSDGSLLEGDNVFAATGKACAVNTATGNLVKKNPALAVLELANFITIGDVPAADITSPITTIKGSMNYALDYARDPHLAAERARAGAYGGNVLSLRDSYELAQSFYEAPSQAFEDVGNVMQDESFFSGMHDTNYKLWRRPDGSQGRVAATAEVVLDMGIAMTKTAGELTASAAKSAGTLVENTSMAIKQRLSSMRSFFRR